MTLTVRILVGLNGRTRVPLFVILISSCSAVLQAVVLDADKDTHGTDDGDGGRCGGKFHLLLRTKNVWNLYKRIWCLGSRDKRGQSKQITSFYECIDCAI